MTRNMDGPKRLSEHEFASAFAKGLGRAKIHVANYGLDKVADIVLDGCVHDRAYDPQCEASRAPWLFSMFAHSPYHDRFRKAIFFALENESDAWDVLQLCELAKEMAVHGDDYARQSLKKRVFEIAGKPSDHDGFGADEWIDLEGVDGFLELARVYGERLLRKPDNYVPDSLRIFHETVDFDWKGTLTRHSEHDLAIKAYFGFLEKQGVLRLPRSPVQLEMARKRRAEQVRSEFPIARIVADARNHAYDYPYRYMAFGRYATKEELEEIYFLMLKEVDEGALVRFLWIFSRAPLPEINPTILNWAKNASGRLRTAAIAALVHSHDPVVHKLAREKVRTLAISGDDYESLCLFTHNYESSDAHLITQALSSIAADTYDRHAIGMDIEKLSEKHGDPCPSGKLA